MPSLLSTGLPRSRSPPTGVSVVSTTLAGHRHIGVAAPATETDQRSRALQEPPLLLGIIESRPPRRISGDNIGRSREINFRDSRPWAAGLPILEVDPVASEAVKVLLPLVEVLLSAVPPDADLWGALTVQKTPVRVEAAADIVQTSAAPGVLGEEKIPVRVVVGAANNGDSSGEAKAVAVVAEPLAHNRPTTKTISQLPRPASTEPT